MKTYLLVWNPKRWDWINLEGDIEEVNNTGRCSESWNCGRNNSIEVGDQIFLIKAIDRFKGWMDRQYYDLACDKNSKRIDKNKISLT